VTTPEAMEHFKRQVLRDGPRLGPADTFGFQCHKGLSCFNECCHDVNLFLSPYDVLRFKSRLGMKSGEFLRRHTIIPFGQSQKYPVVILKMLDDERKSCPFLREPHGCSVYSDRPWACRMYPLGQAAAAPKGEKDESFYFVMSEPFCHGAEAGAQWTVRQWIEDQGIEPYDRAGQGFQRLAQRSPAPGGEELSPQAMDMLFMACYDLDRFRRFVFETSFLEKFDVEPRVIEAIRTDDAELLELGFQWIRFSLWREPAMKLRPEALRAKSDRKAP